MKPKALSTLPISILQLMNQMNDGHNIAIIGHLGTGKAELVSNILNIVQRSNAMLSIHPLQSIDMTNEEVKSVDIIILDGVRTNHKADVNDINTFMEIHRDKQYILLCDAYEEDDIDILKFFKNIDQVYIKKPLLPEQIPYIL